MTFENDYSIAYAIPGMTRQPAKDEIMQCVCRYFGITENDLKKRTRKREVVYHRQICIYLLMIRAKVTCTYLGEYFSQDHSSILYSRDTVKSQLETRIETIYTRDLRNILNIL